MTAVTALLTNKAYGYPTRGARRRRTPTILACLHQTGNAVADHGNSPPSITETPQVSTRVGQVSG